MVSLTGPDLLNGTRRWADFRRGIPLISPAVLSQRLRELEDAGVLARSGEEYHPTAAGLELRPVIEQLGIWGKRWTQRQIDRGTPTRYSSTAPLHRCAALPGTSAVLATLGRTRLWTGPRRAMLR